VTLGAFSGVTADTSVVMAAEPAVKLNQYGLAENVEDGSILHCWCWSFNTIKENIPEIAAAGFSTIQTSPISECLVGGNGELQINGKGKWYYHYQPINYTIGNYQLGTADEFKEMCEVAHQYGIKVIADQVLNHCTSNYDAISDDIKNNIKDPFHDMSVNNWSETDRYEETQYALSGLYEWNTQNTEVQQYMLKWLQTCVEAGADGFRYDAAKLIELPDDTSEKYGNDFASDFWPIVLQNGASFQYGESLQEGGNHKYSSDLKSGYDDNDSSRLAAYQALTYADGKKNLNTTASFYGARVRDAVTESTLNADFVGDFLMPKGASADKVVTWVESHDNYCNDATYRELDEQQVIQAWAILSARKGGTPLFFDRPNNSTSSNPWGDNIIGPAGSDIYKDAQVTAVNFFRNEMGDAEEYLSNPTGDDNVLMIERGDAGCVIINKNDTDIVLDKAPVQNMADGTYTDQAYGSEFTVKDNTISGTVKARKVAVVYNSQLDGRLDFEAAVNLSVPTKEFLTDSLDVTISFRGCESASYRFDDGKEVPCANGEVLTIGEDMNADDSVTLTVTGYDKDGNISAEATATYTKRKAKGDTVIYMDGSAKTEWDNVYVYLWGNGTNGSWPGVKAEKLSDGMYKYVVPYELESVESNVIFNNGSGGGSNQFDAGKISPGQSMIWTADGQWITYEAPIEAKVSLSHGSGTFSTDSFDVTLNVQGCKSAVYKLGDSEPVECKDGDIVTIGKNMNNGDSITLTLTGIDAKGEEISVSATYRKMVSEQKSSVYLDSSVFPEWTDFYVYVYYNDGEVVNGAWPGVQMTDEGDGIYSYFLGDEFEGLETQIIFNNGNGGDGNQSGNQTLKPNTKMILSQNGWIPYGEPEKVNVAVPEAVQGLVYNGAEQSAIAASEAYTVSAGSAVDAGTYTAVISLVDPDAYQWEDGTTGDKKVEWTIQPKESTSLEYSKIEDVTYTGEPQTPNVTIKDGEVILTEGKDYTITYEDNVEVGSAYVIVEYKGNYTGSKTLAFVIKEKTKPSDDTSNKPSEKPSGDQNNKPDSNGKDPSVKPDTGKVTGTQTSTKSPQTGDDANVGILAMLVAFSGLTAVYMARRKRYADK
jgi:alpha-amylase